MTWDKNRITGLIGLVFSIIYIYLAFNIKQPPGLTQDILGSRAFPIIAGVIMLISSLVIFFTRYMENDDDSIGKRELISLLPFILIVLMYVILLPILGTLISTTLLIFVVMNRMSKKIWWKDLIISVSITVVFIILFVVILRVSLPTGILVII